MAAIRAVLPLAEHLIWPSIDKIERLILAGEDFATVTLDGTVLEPDWEFKNLLRAYVIFPIGDPQP